MATDNMHYKLLKHTYRLIFIGEGGSTTVGEREVEFINVS